MAFGFDGEEVVVTGSGGVYVAPVGTAFPDNISAPVTSPWVGLGYLTEDGVKFSFGRETNEIMAWQSFEPIRLTVTKAPKSFTFTLEQINQHTLMLAMGGGSITGTEPNWTYSPPPTSFVDERAVIVEAVDGDKNLRFCFPRALNSEGIDFSFTRNDPVTLAITMNVLAPESGDTWWLQTDDPNVGDLTEAAS